MSIPSSSHLIIPSVLAGSVQRLQEVLKTLQMTLEERLMEGAELKEWSPLCTPSDTLRASKIPAGLLLFPRWCNLS